MIEKEYMIIKITPEELITAHSGIDLKKINSEFKKHCPDYNAHLSANKKSETIEFCSKIIYEVGPETNKVKKGSGVKTWKFYF